MQDGPLKLARPIDPQVLADTMLRVLADADFRVSMREAGRANAARFTRARTAAGYRRFYDEWCFELTPTTDAAAGAALAR
jgi:glycosyltransferase involved in cell wall biosynthesis